MSKFAIGNPYFIIVVCLIVLVVGASAVVQMPVDMFPNMNIPVVVVATFFNGMPPEQIEADITSRYERFFTLASNVEHIESRSLPGVSLIKVYFQPGSNADVALSSISNLSVANLRRLPQGTLPPVVLKFDASSLPVCLVTLKGEGLTQTQVRDLGQYVVRNQIATIPGSSIPQPFGGLYRQIMIYADPLKLEAYQMSPMDVVRAVNDSNLIVPAGDLQIGPRDYSIYTNSQLDTIEEINQLPIKMANGAPVRITDIGVAKDAQQIQTSVVRVDGVRSVYLPVLKQGGDSNTLSVVDGVKSVVGNLLDVPESFTTRVVFDQSRFIRTAIQNLLHEGAIGLVLTSVMILVFLGSMRATVAVLFSIPLSALATFLVLFFGGSTINTMVLGGLALAFSRLIDNSVVVLENIYRHLEMGAPAAEAAERGGREVALPVLAATLTTAIVFFPVTFLYGVSKFLFSALALAVVISLFASYVVAMTVVPLFCARFLKPHHQPGMEAAMRKLSWGEMFNVGFNRLFAKALGGYTVVAQWSIRYPKLTLALFLLGFAAAMTQVAGIGMAFFPLSDGGQFVVNLKAPSGTRLAVTEAEAAKVEELIRSVVPANELDTVVSNVGVTPGMSSIYTTNSAMHTAFVQVSLKPERTTSSFEYMNRLRRRLAEECPQLSTFFQTGSMVDAVLNQGLSAPIDVQVSGRNLEEIHEIALDLQAKIREIPTVSDAYVPQDVDYPALKVDIDRMRASKLGLHQREIMNNIVTALTSNQMIAPSYWVDPKSGNDYMLTVQYPEFRVENIEGFRAIPLRAPGQSHPVRLDALTNIQQIHAPTEVDHYQFRRVIDIFVRTTGEDLSVVANRIDRIVAATRLPANVRVTMRGMVQGMRESFRSFAFGLGLALVLLYLVLVAQFRSFVDPMIILLAVPPGIAGVVGVMNTTDTTLNVMSLMGLVMLVGISVSNSILIVEFTRTLREEGMEVAEAVLTSCRIRLRPVLMTSLATIIGLIPMAMKLGEGSESFAPLARAIVGGLSVSVLFTVFLVPAAYILVHGRRVEARG
ncbi:MAG: efflux RND transporter permease subunit [Acidobacteria bacterium]|nr:efflux RND transporter permease subunit [Acidobacteriota bacterium]